MNHSSYDLDLDTRLNPQAQPGAEIYAAMHKVRRSNCHWVLILVHQLMISSTVVMPLSGLAANTLKMKMYIIC